MDPRWTVCPAGGIDKINPFVSLFGGNKLHVAVLADEAVGDKKKIFDLRQRQILAEGHLWTVAEFLKRKEADIEDIFEPAVFVEILSQCYGLTGSNAITVERLMSADTQTDRLLKRAEALFKVMPDIEMLSHFKPASWLVRNPQVLQADTQAVTTTLERAKEIFAVYNKLL